MKVLSLKMTDFMHKCLFFSIIILLPLCSGCGSLSGDSSQNTPISVSDFKLDTVIQITIYDSTDTTLLDHSLAICDTYEELLSAKDEASQLYQLNHGLLPPDDDGYYTISPDTYALIQKGLEYSELSNGSFNIALAPLTSLWDFSSGEAVVPNQEQIQAVLPYLNTNNILLKAPDKIAFATDTVQDNTGDFQYSVGIDLGGIAKGYIADKIKEYLVSEGVSSAIINLGGNVLCIGSKLDTPFSIGIQRPFADRNETIATMEITDKSIVSSGIYERFFEKDGVLYHHILDATTGYPYDNDLVAVTIVTDSSTDADALSTTCYSLGLEQGLALINQLDYADAVFITKDNEIHYSEGFEDKYNVVQTP